VGPICFRIGWSRTSIGFGPWNGLKRGDNNVPFWDDVKFSMQARLARDVLLIGAFENPLWFRLDLVGDDITQRYGAAKPKLKGGTGYSRPIMPLWGNGRIEMLLGTIAGTR
jgi:hypothetical protein